MATMDVYTITQNGRTYICIDHAERNQDEHTGLRRTNFAGRPDNFNNTTKQFQVQITEEMVPFFEEQGIKVDTWADRNTGDPIYCVNVFIDYRHTDWYPTDVYVVENGKEIYYKEEDLHMLDNKDFEEVDLKLRKKPKYDRARNKIPGKFSLYLEEGDFTEMINRFSQRHPHNQDRVSPREAEETNAPENEEEVPFN